MKAIKTYHEPRWERLRQQVLRRDNYIDQIEKRYGRTKQAEVVHHIFPVEYFPEYQYEAWNCISVTKKTHNRLHDRNGADLTEEGKRLLIRTATEQGLEVPQIEPQRKIKTHTWFGKYDPPTE